MFDVDLSVPPGSVYGLVGPNGAGKTTMLAILTGMRRADRGEVGLSVPRSRVAVCPDVPEFDAWLTAFEVVDLARSLIGAGDNSEAPSDAVFQALTAAGLADVAERQAGGFSGGMTQRLGFACALVGDPELLILDGPTSALDPAGRAELLSMVAGLRGRRTVIFSSHILDDVHRVADQVGILRDWRLLYQGATQHDVAEDPDEHPAPALPAPGGHATDTPRARRPGHRRRSPSPTYPCRLVHRGQTSGSATHRPRASRGQAVASRTFAAALVGIMAGRRADRQLRPHCARVAPRLCSAGRKPSPQPCPTTRERCSACTSGNLPVVSPRCLRPSGARHGVALAFRLRDVRRTAVTAGQRSVGPDGAHLIGPQVLRGWCQQEERHGQQRTIRIRSRGPRSHLSRGE